MDRQKRLLDINDPWVCGDEEREAGGVEEKPYTNASNAPVLAGVSYSKAGGAFWIHEYNGL